ncbi:MAG: hypothetical protein HQL66_13675 [Magnetococcales bacterium]|nr:hypothetical protein [Magnetococcales bacterium]
MNRPHTVLAALIVAAMIIPQSLFASSGGAPLPQEDWRFRGIFGQFDTKALKRGAKVASEVCLGCHSIKYIKFDALRAFGFSEAEIDKMAAAQGRTKKDRMLSAMEPAAAKESFNVVPPDLSLITKARKGYEDYVFGILVGYVKPEEMELVKRVMADDKLTEEELKEVASRLSLDAHHPEKVKETLARIIKGDQFNRYFPGNFFAMPQPLSAGQVEYTDGTENTLPQMARDVVTFLAWAAEPTAPERKSTGHMVLLYLVVLTAMLYAVKKRIWSRVH